jgi:DNA (cytosine-5)-methyltransferase 1
MNDQRTHIDLFSGIGGFALAANAAGFRTSVFCEQDEYCTKVLRRHWPTVPIIPDIRDFDGSKWRGAGLLTGGFPCQPFSVAGEQRGEEDDRALWKEMFRVIKEARPRFVLAENVAGLINMALDDVLSQLEGEGYTTGAVVLPACAVNAPHRRDRVWICAYSKGASTGQVFQQGGGLPFKSGGMGGSKDVAHAKHKERQETGPSGGREKEKRNPSADAFTGCGGAEDVAHANSERGCGGEREREYATDAGEPSGSPELRNWDTEPDVGRVAHGIPHRTHRLKALGNAIVPQVAYEILKHI